MSAEREPQDETPPIVGLLRRFSRSSSRSVPTMNSTAEKASPDAVATTNDIAIAQPAKLKITALARLKTQLGRRGKKSKVQFPPSSWGAERPGSSRDCATTTPVPTPEEPAQPPHDTTPGSSPRSSHDTARPRASKTPVDPIPNSDPNGDDSPTMSAATLARRIQSLLSSFPPFYALSPSGSLRLPKFPSDQSDGSPDPGPPFADSKLLSLLSSASAMNGSISKGRESVWAILERLRYAPNAKSGSQEKGEGEPGSLNPDDEDCEVSSVMICCPLEPTEDTDVEIARSEIVSIDMEETEVEKPPETPKEHKVGINIWPFGKGKGKAEAPSQEQPKPAPKVKEVRVWFPSRTKVSLQAAWWGYRIYLPPPVMRVLNDKSLEAAKRAAMITAALSWLVSHIPTGMLPPQLRAVVEIVKGIVPVLGYVGGFIAWSWSTIQGFDKGQGVILSATWLLPIALVPGTWHYIEPPPSNTANSGGGSATTPPRPPPKDSSPTS